MTKTCSSCKQEFPLAFFVKDKNRKDGLYPVCKNCTRIKAQKIRAKYPHKSQGYTRKYKYGITNEQYESKLNEQEMACAICKTTVPGGNKKSFFIDHNHKTNQVRGLLCRSCNLMIGHAIDDVNILQAAINYLKKYEVIL